MASRYVSQVLEYEVDDAESHRVLFLLPACHRQAKELVMFPCKGERGPTWHKNNKVPHCDQSRTRMRAHHNNSRNARGPWIPGTPILVPEHEEL